jgi:hypothetical protein
LKLNPYHYLFEAFSYGNLYIFSIVWMLLSKA